MALPIVDLATPTEELAPRIDELKVFIDFQVDTELVQARRHQD